MFRLVSAREFMRGLLLAAALMNHAPALAAPQDRRDVSIADSIELQNFGTFNDRFGGDESRLILSSPGKRRFAFVTNAGNLKSGTTDYSIFVFRAPEAAEKVPKAPRRLITLSSPNNRASIDKLRWLNDGRTLVFIGESNGVRRVFKVDAVSAKLTPLTREGLDVIDFDISEDGRTLVYLEPQILPPVPEAKRRAGILIDSNVSFFELAQGPSFKKVYPGRLIVVRDGRTASYALPFKAAGSAPYLSISPSGSFLLMVETRPANLVPEHWKKYGLRQPWSRINWIVDTTSGVGRVLLDAPHYPAPVRWADDRTVILPDAFAPLSDETEGNSKPRNFALAVDVKSGVHTKISAGRFRIESLDREGGLVFLRPLESRSSVPAAAFRKTSAGWVGVVDAKGEHARPVVAQALNAPPRLMWESDGSREAFFDPNPQLRNIELCEAREVELPLRDGKSLPGIVFLPPGWTPQKKYPAVIQTHGVHPDRFTMDGDAMTSGYAARVLAARGVLVVQVQDVDAVYRTIMETPREGAQETEAFEDVVDELVRTYGVDTDRIGILGFSRTGIAVRHALVNSARTFAAAALPEAGALNYSEWLFNENLNFAQDTYAKIVGAEPVGEGLKVWIERASGFAAHRLKTPTLVMGFGAWAGINVWEEFVVLRHLKKPAEFVLLPDAAHNPVRPLERLSVQARVVDWFRFWLQDYEDPDVTKAEQYVRWRELREQRDKLR
jgi:dipeptidyl aminopeptidase/acylaminoacyl peptidase